VKRSLGAAGLACAAFAALILIGAVHATAGERLRGIVIAVTGPAAVLVHHDPFGGMPAMTMTFAVPSGTTLHPGDRIVATVDETSQPWSLTGISVTGSQIPARPARLPAFVRVGETPGDPPFVDQTGRPFRLASLRGRPYALAFVYTRCRDPDECPLVSGKFHVLQDAARPQRFALVEVSLDPAYDRPPVLARYAATFGMDARVWHIVTGPPRAVLDFAARFGILERSAGPVTIAHSERLVIVDGSGRIGAFVDGARWSTHAVASALSRER
jgi:protein SCO1/2